MRACVRCGKPALGFSKDLVGNAVLAFFHRSGSVHGPPAAAMIRQRIEAIPLLLDTRRQNEQI